MDSRPCYSVFAPARQALDAGWVLLSRPAGPLPDTPDDDRQANDGEHHEAGDAPIQTGRTDGRPPRLSGVTEVSQRFHSGQRMTAGDPITSDQSRQGACRPQNGADGDGAGEEGTCSNPSSSQGPVRS
jgi:hypothetical protein